MRRVAVAIHLWLGLVVGGLWALQGLTGALIVFHREAEVALAPEAATGDWLALDRLAAAGGLPVQRLMAFDTQGRILAADYEDASGDRRRMLVEAVTGRVLSDQPNDAATPWDAPIAWVVRLHHDLLSGETGELALGVSGLLLASGCALGLWIALPWRRLADVRRWRIPRQRAWGWHRLVGVTAAVALLPLALTGAYFTWSKEVRQVVGTVATFAAPPVAKTRLEAGAQVIGAEAAWQMARAEFPGARFASLALPGAKGAEYRFRLLQSGETRQLFGTTSVWVDAVTGDIVWRYDALNAPLANRIIDAVFSFHSGEIAGLFGRLLVMAAGLALPALWLTGLWLWLLKRRRPAPMLAAPAE